MFYLDKEYYGSILSELFCCRCQWLFYYPMGKQKASRCFGHWVILVSWIDWWLGLVVGSWKVVSFRIFFQVEGITDIICIHLKWLFFERFNFSWTLGQGEGNPIGRKRSATTRGIENNIFIGRLPININLLYHIYWQRACQEWWDFSRGCP